MKKYLIAAVALSAIASPAAAQEENNFAGVKVGVIAGYDSYKISYEGESGSQDGFQYGLTAGYDHSIGGGIIGVEAELGDSTVKETERDGDDFISLSADRELYVGVRAGFVASPSMLVYAKAGYVNSKLKLTEQFDGDRVSLSDELDGYRLGAGVEYAPSTFFGRLEYRFSDFGDYEIAGFDTGLSSSRHQVVATLGTRF